MPAVNSLDSLPIERKTLLPFPTADPLLVSETPSVGSRSEPIPVPAIAPGSQSGPANTASRYQILPSPNIHSSSRKHRHTALQAPLRVVPEEYSHRPCRSHAPTNADWSRRHSAPTPPVQVGVAHDSASGAALSEQPWLPIPLPPPHIVPGMLHTSLPARSSAGR